MNQALAALRADRAALLEICGGLAAADWQAPSGCEGWTVQDLVAHLGPCSGWLWIPASCRQPRGCRPSRRRN